ncbi:MAG: methylase, partial [Oscillospiraceae bacterium]|nr:methylase [Oscillospiraceae bacterium]
MTEKEQKKAAKEFAEYWKDKGDEKQETARFWIELLSKVLGVDEPTKFIEFEKTVIVEKNQKYIDGYIPSTKILIEQKGSHIKLGKTAVQSDGERLTPYGQAFRYNNYLPYDEKAKWIIVSNFTEILIYNMNKPNAEPEQIFLKDLPKECYRLQFLTDTKSEFLKKEMEISLKAGELVGKIYDAILKQYNNTDSPETLKSLNMLCVRLVFCLYAEDAGIFGQHELFGNYLKKFSVNEMRKNLIELFHVLDTKPENRDPYMEDELAAFPYVNGGLFADENIEIPRFTDEIVDLLVNKASAEFDWSQISPTIFGAVFESTLNPETRRKGGMHYTSLENIHKVIDPLFLDDLKAELNEIKALKVAKTKNQRLRDFRKKLSELTFLDPAAGSGNFLTETYISLRRLENDALYEENHGQMMLGGEGEFNPIQVSIGQFYGIEINDFAVTVAKTALWIAESQMMQETEQLMQINLDFLPLKSYANIVEGNSLRIDWDSVVPKDKLSFIMGNPPFVGARLMNNIQKSDVLSIFDGVKNNGNLDYVSCWYKKATDMMTGTEIRTALVSTNSITQGEQVAILWKNLFNNGVHIDFAYRTFRWDSEASIKAHVHCVIIGFSKAENKNSKRIFDNGSVKVVKNINGYLVEADDIVIESKTTPICYVPKIGIGNQPIDDGNYLFTKQEMEEFIKSEPKSASYFKKWYGSREFINGLERYCLWLGECSPKELRSMPECMKRIENVRQFRLSSKRASTIKLADMPTRFQTENMPSGNSIIIPETSSENRKYIPIGFISPEILCSNAVRLIPNATLYHFGIL